MYLARRPIPSRNANSVQIVTMCEAFANIGHQVTLVGQPGDAPAELLYERYGVSRTFAVQTLPRSDGRGLPKWRYLAALKPLIRSTPIDLYFGRDIWSLVMASRTGKPVIYEAHVIPPDRSLRSRLLARLFAKPNFAHLVCVTSTLAELYRAQFPELAGKRIIVAPNAAAEPRADLAVTGWPGREGVLQAGFVGRPYPGKGIELIVEAAAQLGDVDFHIVGAARTEIGWIEREVPANVYFHGYQPHSALAGYYRHFDVALAPYRARVLNASSQESAAITSPLKLIEYLAAGLPSVVSDLPGVRDMIADPEAALLVPPDDVGRLVAAIRRLQDPAERQRVGAAARREYLGRHTATARARAVLGELAREPVKESA